MPRYDFECASGHVTEREYGMFACPTSIDCEKCLKPAKKIISRVALMVPTHMTAANDWANGASRARQREWMRKPEIHKKLVEGELTRDETD